MATKRKRSPSVDSDNEKDAIEEEDKMVIEEEEEVGEDEAERQHKRRRVLVDFEPRPALTLNESRPLTELASAIPRTFIEIVSDDADLDDAVEDEKGEKKDEAKWETLPAVPYVPPLLRVAFGTNNGPGPITELLPELVLFTSTRFLDVTSMARLACTNRRFNALLARNQNGPLYYPTHWRRHLESASVDRLIEQSNLATGCIPHSLERLIWLRMMLRRFILDKAACHVFDGLKGGQALVKVNFELASKEYHAANVVFKVSCGISKVDFVYPVQYGPALGPPWNRYSVVEAKVSLPSSVDIVAFKKAIRAAHASKLVRNRRRRTVPPNLLAERARLKHEVAQLRSDLNERRKKIVDAMRGTVHMDAFLVGLFAESMGKFQKKAATFLALSDQLENVEEQIDAALDGERKEEKEEEEEEEEDSEDSAS